MFKRRLLEYALLSLSRRWKKQLALLLVYALVVAFYASVIFFTTSLRYETQLVMTHLPELWIQKLSGGRLSPMPASFVDSLKNIRGVKRIIPRIWGYNFDSPTGAVFTIWGSDSLLAGLDLLEGHMDKKLDDKTCVVGRGLLSLRGLKLGENLTLLDDQGQINSFLIKASFESASDLLTRDLIILSPNAARKMLGLQAGEMTDVGLEIYNEQEIDNIGRKIDRRFPGIRVVTAPQLRSTYETLFSWRGGIFVYGATLAIFAFLILAWEKASGLGKEERQELGILKALGWQISEVLWVKFWESLALSLTATLLGTLLALIHVFGIGAPLLKPFLIGWSVLYPDYDLVFIWDVSTFLLIISLSMIPYLSATLIPAWRGAITDPAEIMLNN